MKNFLMILCLAIFTFMIIGMAHSITVDLGTAGDFVILSKSGISTTGVTQIVGNIGVSPIDSTAITGFGLIMNSLGAFSKSTLVTGKVYAADYAPPTPSMLSTAIGDMQTAYTDAAGRAAGVTELGSGNIGGLTIAPGVYKWGTGVIIPTDVILSGNENAVWIFQIAQTLNISSGKKVILMGGAQAKNIFWQVAGATTLETYSTFNGNILDQTNIAVRTGAVLNGRALAQTAVTLDANTIQIDIDDSPEETLYTITASAETNGSINPTGNVEVSLGANQTFAIIPNTGYAVKDVLVDGTSVGAIVSYTFNSVAENHTISATFASVAINTYAITATAGDNGQISPSGTVNVNQGAAQTFTITPNMGYQIADVKVDGVSVGAVATHTISNIVSSHTISATFASVAINTYAITASAGINGRISPSGTVNVNQGANQTFTITPNMGYQIADVKVDGVSVGAVATHTISDIVSSHTISATFAINTYTITASAGINGRISPSGTKTANHGSSAKFTVTPDENYHIAGLLVDGAVIASATEYTFANISANHTISATFAINTYTIAASAGINGRISPSGAVIVNHNASQTFTMIPTAGNQVTDIKVDGKSVGVADTYTITGVTGNRTISVTFEEVINTITATAKGPGTISPAGAVKVGHVGMKIFVIKPNAGARLVDVVIDGNSMGPLLAYQFTNVRENHAISALFEQKENVLMQNFPNPFNPETWIPFELKENSEVKIRIYNSTGRLVRELNLGSKVAGIYATPAMSAYWDGKDESGVSVASGIYFYSIQAGTFSAVKKMIVSR